MADEKRVDELVAEASKEILEDIDDLLRVAHKKGIKEKSNAVTYVVNGVFAQLIRNPGFANIIRTREGRELLREVIRVEVEKRIEDRRKEYAKTYRDIMKSEKSAERKREEINRLKDVYFGKEDVEELRKKELEKRKERREFSKGLEKESELVEKWEREDEAWDREVERMGLMEAERPWKKYPARFRSLPLRERERIREEWYKEQRKKYKETYGLWDRAKLWGKDKGKVRIEKARLRADRGIAYGDAKVKDADAYVKKYREYQKLKESGASKEELREAKMELNELKRKARGSMLKRGIRGANRFASAPGKFAKSTKSLVMKGFILACFVGIGAVAMAVIGSWLFFLGFLAWGLYYLLPDPNDISPPDYVKDIGEDNPLIWKMVFAWNKDNNPYLRNSHTGWGVLRSFVKISVFVFFILGINSANVPLGNIALIILSFFGYYSLKITYDVDKPYQLIESIIRFGFLGFYFIPWIIMYGLFDSMLLAFIAMAFFAIPPIPKDRKSSELMAMYDFYDKIIFGIIMIGVLIGFLAGWEVSTALSATFIYFWFVTGIAGFFSPAEARPAMGFLMLGAATVIYGIGPGTQEVMSALFGPWWPTIQNSFQSISEPIGQAFGGFANTLRSGWLLLTDPVGYATQLMNGTHAANPTGKTGALGVEITDVTISPIFSEQPFLITAMIKNEGSLNAENVIIYLSTGYEAPTERKPSALWGPLLLLIPKAHRPDVLKLGQMFGIEDEEIVKCHEDKDDGLSNGCQNELEKQNVWQEVFTSNAGVSCKVIEDYKLREKYIPVKVSVTYNYSSYSTVDVEFITQNEWQRLAESNQLNQKLRFIQSKYSTAPVEFPIGTPGLKNPILASQPFHLGIRIESGSLKGSIEHVGEVLLEYPADFEIDPKGCTPGGSGPTDTGKGTKRIVWKNLAEGPKVFYCPFKPLGESKMSGPTKTYVVKAYTNYTFTTWREKDTKIEFGGKCCSKNDCLEGQECVSGMCVAKGTVVTSCDFEPTSKMDFKEIPKYSAEISAAVQKHGLTSYMDSSYAAEALVAAVINQESSWNANTKTHEPNAKDYSFGLMQIRFATAGDLGFPFKTTDTADNYPCSPEVPGNLCYPSVNIDYGTKYLAQRLKISCGGKCTKSSLMCSISNYNAGSGCPMGTNENNCKYVKGVLENYYKYYFFYDYCGWWEKQGLMKCTLGMGGCTGDSQCDTSVVYGPENGTKKAPICRTDIKPKVCCPPSDIFDKSRCESAYSTWKSQG